MASGRPSATALRQLRYFRYLPPAGGLGGEWDSLEAQARCGDDAELARVLALLGHRGAPPPAGEATYLGMLTAGATSIAVTVLGEGSGGGRALTLLGAIYVTDDVVAQVAALERWLDEHGVAMVPRDRT